jgi:hypothetical protein
MTHFRAVHPSLRSLTVYSLEEKRNMSVLRNLRPNKPNVVAKQAHSMPAHFKGEDAALLGDSWMRSNADRPLGIHIFSKHTDRGQYARCNVKNRTIVHLFIQSQRTPYSSKHPVA